MSIKRNSYFAKPDVQKERMEICRACEHYFKPTGTCKICGCFMRIKSKLGGQSCAATPKKWHHTGDYYAPKDIPQDLIQEVMDIYPLFENGKAPNYQVKEDMILLFNVIHGTAHSLKTNCSSCLYSIYKSFTLIYEENKK